MLKKTIQKFISNPITYSKILFLKVFVYPYKYKRGVSDYKAEKYWEDRFIKHGLDIRGAGDEGESEWNNTKRYERVTSVLKEILKSNINDFQNLKVLEIGTGTGLITNALKELGILNYIGVDITSVLFCQLQKAFGDFKFKKLDITTDFINDKFDLIVIIDVIEHIVENGKFAFAMHNIRDSLKNNGLLVIAPIVTESYKAQFYERHWSIEDIMMYLPDLEYLSLWDWELNVSKIYLLRSL